MFKNKKFYKQIGCLDMVLTFIHCQEMAQIYFNVLLSNFALTCTEKHSFYYKCLMTKLICIL